MKKSERKELIRDILAEAKGTTIDLDVKSLNKMNDTELISTATSVVILKEIFH